jgi:hypothetical protein
MFLISWSLAPAATQTPRVGARLAREVTALNDLGAATDEFQQLDAIRRISEELRPNGGPEQSQSRMVLHSLIGSVWDYTFMHYYALQRERKDRAAQDSGRSQ